MRIGFDGKRVVQNFTGLGNYSRFILDLLNTHFPENEYWVYSKKKASDNLKIPKGVKFRHPARYKFAPLWRSYGVLRNLKKDNITLYHGLSNELPFGIYSAKIPSVVTIHDLIFLRFPDFYPALDRFIYRYKFDYACKKATRIIAVSEQTKKDIISYFGTPAEKIDVIYQGCNDVFKNPASDEHKKRVSKKFNLPDNYLLQVGTIEERKNLLLTVKALRNVPQNVKLVVIGKQTDYIKEIKEYILNHKLENRVIFLKNVPVEDLPAIYQQARIFVYPSEFEGFGIPVIEALYSGVPVIAATGSCLEEAGGPKSCYIHPKDDVQLSWTINSILNNPSKSAEMVEAGYEYVKKFSEAELAKKLMEVYKKVLNHA
ncbi:glycosyltransferase family 4 protein [Paradesertivirga mongoliensis]|uniref:Glycosyltransferase family 4 protein n=1 Tax=Paradesertivirga mongoliensis TaxID=2100740 RepID=A0ABW4ZKG0_9SPHI|nr:glycosyltransferase family 1 protein [Pedobacter mongoliensis]